MLRRTCAAAALLAVLAAGLQPLAHAEDKPEAKTAVKWGYNAVYKDEATGRSYFNAHAWTGSEYASRVVFEDGKGGWYALPERYRTVYRTRTAPARTLVDEAGAYGFLSETEIYDPARDSITRTTEYIASPDGKYGFREQVYFGKQQEGGGYYYYTKLVSLLVKNYANGSVHEALLTPGYTGASWTRNDRLLAELYNTKEKQHEIVAVDPATGRTQRVLLASLYGYAPDRGLILFAYNEPQRKQWIYDMNTGKIRPAQQQDSELFDYQHNGAAAVKIEQPDAAPPSDMAPDRLPVQPTALRTIYGAQLVVDGTPVMLPSAFVSEGKAYVPALPLIEAFGIAVKQNGRQFTLTRGGRTVSVDGSNSRLINFRLLIQTGTLRQLGLQPQSLNWLTDTQ